MIVYGTKGSNLRNGRIINTNCPNCNEVTSMVYSSFAKYVHIYWIPMIPYKKVTFVECDKCRKTFEQKEFSKDIEAKLLREKEKNGRVAYPFWMFSGAAIIMALSGFAVYQSNVDDENEKKYAENPQKGDLYHFRLTNGFYTSAKITNADKDSVYLIFSNYETDQVTGIDDISKPENFTVLGKYSYNRERIKELLEKDTIYQIDRN